MLTLHDLIVKQGCKCYYCGVTMLTNCSKGDARQATVEHLVDKWSSPKHRKIEDDSNRVSACFTCNNTRGNIRNRIARSYYQNLIGKRGLKMKAASTASSQLYKMFGPVPQEMFGVV